MTNLHFIITKHQLIREDNEILASFSKNINRCIFLCENMIADIYKYALFTDVSNNQYFVELGLGEKVSCVIPEEVLQGNYFSVSVFGGERFTTTQSTVLIMPSGFNQKTLKALEDEEDVVGGNVDSGYHRKRIRDEIIYRKNKFEIQEHPHF